MRTKFHFFVQQTRKEKIWKLYFEENEMKKLNKFCWKSVIEEKKIKINI